MTTENSITTPETSYILCAVRSRPGGEETVHRAIDLALESGARLTFLQIVDAGFVAQLSHRSSSRKAALRELTEMARFTLQIVCEQAEKAGVRQVDFQVREGSVRDELIQATRELQPDALILGRPQMDGRSTFPGDARARFIADLEAETGVRVL